MRAWPRRASFACHLLIAWGGLACQPRSKGPEGPPEPPNASDTACPTRYADETSEDPYSDRGHYCAGFYEQTVSANEIDIASFTSSVSSWEPDQGDLLIHWRLPEDRPARVVARRTAPPPYAVDWTDVQEPVTLRMQHLQDSGTGPNELGVLVYSRWPVEDELRKVYTAARVTQEDAATHDGYQVLVVLGTELASLELGIGSLGSDDFVDDWLVEDRQLGGGPAEARLSVRLSELKDAPDGIYLLQFKGRRIDGTSTSTKTLRVYLAP